MASDRLRAALQFADPVRLDRTTHHDQLDFRVRLQGDEGMSLLLHSGRPPRFPRQAAAAATRRRLFEPAATTPAAPPPHAAGHKSL